ncbi:hypothetical protein ILYODFUR_003842 [Ilyodon furcidens]|uniref:Uncharacterized protein n=1 Tax=Ilyodon furcidens TaxID=33524 RepID=A0ABV0T639_9TELE
MLLKDLEICFKCHNCPFRNEQQLNNRFKKNNGLLMKAGYTCLFSAKCWIWCVQGYLRRPRQHEPNHWVTVCTESDRCRFRPWLRFETSALQYNSSIGKNN